MPPALSVSQPSGARSARPRRSGRPGRRAAATTLRRTRGSVRRWTAGPRRACAATRSPAGYGSGAARRPVPAAVPSSATAAASRRPGLGRPWRERERSPPSRVSPDERAPELVGDERDDRVQQPQHGVQAPAEHRARAVGRRPARPAAAPWPARRTSRRARPRRSGRARRRPCRIRRPRSSASTSAVTSSSRVRIQRSAAVRLRVVERQRRIGAVHQRETRGVPELVDEVAAALDPFLRQRDVAARVRRAGERPAQRVGAVVVDELRAGRSTLPADLLIFLPRASRTRPCTITSRNGTSGAMNVQNIIIRATQKKMMS